VELAEDVIGRLVHGHQDRHTSTSRHVRKKLHETLAGCAIQSTQRLVEKQHCWIRELSRSDGEHATLASAARFDWCIFEGLVGEHFLVFLFVLGDSNRKNGITKLIICFQVQSLS